MIRGYNPRCRKPHAEDLLEAVSLFTQQSQVSFVPIFRRRGKRIEICAMKAGAGLQEFGAPCGIGKKLRDEWRLTTLRWFCDMHGAPVTFKKGTCPRRILFEDEVGEIEPSAVLLGDLEDDEIGIPSDERLRRDTKVFGEEGDILRIEENGAFASTTSAAAATGKDLICHRVLRWALRRREPFGFPLPESVRS